MTKSMQHDFQWKEEYSVHVKEIDDQHKRLVETIFKLFTAINQQSAGDIFKNILNDLTEYVEHHFSTEEKYFKAFNYEFADEHIKEHRRFAEKIADFKKRYVNHEIEISFELIDFLEDWLLEHLITADQKYVNCFASHGLK